MLKVIAGRKAELKTKDCGGSDCAKGCDGGGRGSGCTVAMLEATAEVEVIVSSEGHVHRGWRRWRNRPSNFMISKRITWSCLRKGGCCCDVAVIGGEVDQVAARLLPKGLELLFVKAVLK